MASSHIASRREGKKRDGSTTHTMQAMAGKSSSPSAKPTSLVRRLFRRASNATARSPPDSIQEEEETPNPERKTNPKRGNKTSKTMKRSKSEKQVTSRPQLQANDNYSYKSATLPSQTRRHHSPKKTRPSPVILDSPTRRPRYHTPVTIGTSSSPPMPHSFSRQQLMVDQTTSSWDISPTGEIMGQYSLKQAARSIYPLPPSIPPPPPPMDLLSSHTYSEPYHWLIPARMSSGAPVTHEEPIKSAPPLPPRCSHNTVFTGYMNLDVSLSVDNLSDPRTHEYMRINPFMLNPKADPSDYQQPIVTQTTPLPSCIRHRKMDQRQREDSSPEIKESSPEEKEDEACKILPDSGQPSRSRPDTRRTTVVILDDDRTLKV